MLKSGAKIGIAALVALLTIGTLSGQALAAVETPSEAVETVPDIDVASVANGTVPENSSATTTDQAAEPSAEARRGVLFWDKVLSVVGLHEEKPFKPDHIAGAPVTPAQDYIIGPGDQLGISVWRDDALTRVVVVLPDGKIQFPLIGELVAGGKTVAQLKKEIEDKLSGFVVDSGLSVEVRQSSSMFVYLIGKVNAPGRQMLVANTNVLQALATAGGLNPFADKDDIKIIRQEGERTLIYPFRYSLVAAGSNLEENIWLKRGDVIVVP